MLYPSKHNARQNLGLVPTTCLDLALAKQTVQVCELQYFHLGFHIKNYNPKIYLLVQLSL